MRKTLQLMELVKNYNRIAMLGLGKNAGKTTTLDFILKNISMDLQIGITSIGHDGQKKDLLFGNEKPSIYIHSGIVIATTKSYLKACDITYEILHATGLNTSMGEVIIIKALSDGFVEISGPSTNLSLKKCLEIMNSFNAKLILIDGAIDRKAFSVSGLVDGIVMCTGAGNFKDEENMILETIKEYNILNMDILWDEKIKNIVKENKNLEEIYLDLDGEKTTNLSSKAAYIWKKGAVTDKLLKRLLNNLSSRRKITLISNDPTKIFVSSEILSRFIGRGNSIYVLEKIKIIAIAVNPVTYSGDKLNSNYIVDEIEKKTGALVLDVCE